MVEKKHKKRKIKDIGVYLSGPMTGIPDLNAPLFNEIENMLRNRRFEHIYNPAKHDDPKKHYADLLLKDLKWIRKQADFIIMLPSSEKSKGARVEYHFAKACKIPLVCLYSYDTFQTICIKMNALQNDAFKLCESETF